MESMWAGGWSTLQHGGSVIVISTPCGLGNWYWSTWTGAKDKKNDFNPIEINWWDMDWTLKWINDVNKQPMELSPLKNMRECKTKEEYEKYGPYWSPWLESEYRGLQQKGEGHLFKQEILAEFMGSGNTIVSTTAINRVIKTVKSAPQPKSPTKQITYIHPISNEREALDFSNKEAEDGLIIWREPIKPEPPILKHGKLYRSPNQGHIYAIGADIATGQDKDFSVIQVMDVITREQVAEYMGHVPHQVFSKMLDYVGRWYNNALICIERTGIGQDLIEDMHELLYPNIWRKKTIGPEGLSFSKHGFATTESSKPVLIKALCMNLSEVEDEGYTMYSDRFLKQLSIFIRVRNRHGHDTGKIGAQRGRGNYDDLVMGAALAFIAAADSVDDDITALIPSRSQHLDGPVLENTTISRAEQQRSMIATNDPGLIMPFNSGAVISSVFNPQDALDNFTKQLSAGSRPGTQPIISQRKSIIYPRKKST